jgi:membrane protease YdiL (CAAX protease family)
MMIKFSKKEQKAAIELIFLVIIYFSTSFLVPWEELSLNTISSSYIFDFIFWLMIATYLREEPKWGHITMRGTVPRVALIIVISLLVCCLSIFLKLNSPFRYLDQLALKLLILAPFFEEIVFRGAFFNLLTRLKRLKRWWCHLMNGLLFSLSHSFALYVLPIEFISFVWYQIVYTFILGWCCSVSREKSGGLIEPILIHFIFNLIFYFFIEYYQL